MGWHVFNEANIYYHYMSLNLFAQHYCGTLNNITYTASHTVTRCCLHCMSCPNTTTGCI
eukprot:m.35206 g.35206  ORF g.35206 m.35206 type:complete len:59 (-) comp14388_c0_seq1:694-870(-)